MNVLKSIFLDGWLILIILWVGLAVLFFLFLRGASRADEDIDQIFRNELKKRTNKDRL